MERRIDDIFTKDGIIWPEEIAKIVKTSIAKNDANAERYFNLFFMYEGVPEEFIDIENYRRFCETFCEDYFSAM